MGGFDINLVAQLGMGLAEAVAMANASLAAPAQAQQLPSNLTGAMVADAAVAGTTLAAMSCGPPNSLSSGRQAHILVPSTGEAQSHIEPRISTCIVAMPLTCITRILFSAECPCVMLASHEGLSAAEALHGMRSMDVTLC